MNHVLTVLLMRFAAGAEVPGGGRLTSMRMQRLMKAVAGEHQPSTLPKYISILQIPADLPEPPANCDCEECALRRAA